MAEGMERHAFIGRRAELARLRAALVGTVAARAGRTVVVGGEAGIGKSRLIERFAEEATGAARVLTGACLEVADGALPYAPFVEILRSIVRGTPEARLPAVLGPGRAELTRLLPELATRSADLPAASEVDRASQARLFELVLGMFERLGSEQPLVLIVEDAQWADRSTRDLIGFLSRALRDDPVLIVLTVRTDAAGEAVGNLAFIAELEREEHVQRLELAAFDRDEVAEQAAVVLGEPASPELLDRLVARSDGNPFYVEELLRAASAGAQGMTLPPVLRDVLTAHIAGLSKGAREILRAAAAAGRTIDDELLAATLDMSPREIAGGLREALASGVLTRVETGRGSVSSFRHALLQEVVDAELFPGERSALHAAFGEALEHRLASGDGSVAPVEIARHWDAAQQPARALPFLIHAATSAEAVYAFAEAQRLWERAAEILEEEPVQEVGGRDLPELLVRAGDCAVLVGAPGHAAELVQRALVHVYPSGEQERVLFLENRFRWHLWWSGQRGAAVAAIERALASLPAGPATATPRSRILAQLAAVRMMAGDFEASAAHAREAIELAAAGGTPVEAALAHGVLGWDLAMLGDIEAGLEEYRSGQAIAEATGSVEGMALAATNLAALLDRLGRSEASLDVARNGYAMTERFGVARTYGAVLLGYAAKAELALGRWDEADRSTAMGLRRGAIDAGAVWLQINRARLLVGRGDFGEAALLLRRARGTDERLAGTDYTTALLAAEAELAAWSGDVAAAMRLGEAGLAAAERAPAPDPSLAWLAALVLRAIADHRARGGGAARGAQDLAGREAVLLARIDAAVAAATKRPGFGTGERALALVALLQAERRRLEGRGSPMDWADVATHWAGLSRPFQVGYARLRQAEAVLASRGDRAAAAAALEEAAAIAATLGAAPLAAQVRTLAGQARISLPALAAAAGGPESAPTAHATDDLTGREAEVLRLVAAGWTNQQIADALFITRKTAGVHVSNIMAKLGAGNRGEAAALARRLGLVDEAALPVAHRG